MHLKWLQGVPLGCFRNTIVQPRIFIQYKLHKTSFRSSFKFALHIEVARQAKNVNKQRISYGASNQLFVAP